MNSKDWKRRDFLRTAVTTTLGAALSGAATETARAAETFGKMPMRTLGRTGLHVSMIGLGGYHVGLMQKDEDAIALVRRALDLGITFFDNADCYQGGLSEQRMGKALEGRRRKIVLMTKVDQRDAKGSRETLEKSLRNLRTDYLDLWQFHSVRTMDDVDKIFGPGGAMETAEKARKEGKIRFIGVTGHYDPEVHLEALQRYPFDTIQMPVNVVDPHYRSFRKTVLDGAVKRNTAVIAMKTLSDGRILSFQVAKAEEALPWVWSQPVSVLVSGCDRIEVLDYNVYLAKTFRPLSESEQAALIARTQAHAGTLVENYKRSA